MRIAHVLFILLFMVFPGTTRTADAQKIEIYSLSIEDGNISRKIINGNDGFRQQQKSNISKFSVPTLNKMLQSEKESQFGYNNYVLPGISDLSSEELLRKGKRKSTIGTVLAGAGGAGVLLGVIAIASGSKQVRNSSNPGETVGGFLGTGVGIAFATMGGIVGLTSIPFFIRGSNLKKKAQLQLNTGSLHVPGKNDFQNANNKNIGLSLNINL